MPIKLDTRWVVVFAVCALALFASMYRATSQDSGVPLQGYEIVVAVSDHNDLSYKEVYAECPEGKSAIGGGAGIFWGDGSETRVMGESPVLISNFMYPLGESWYGEAIAPEGTAPWRLEVQVICAYTDVPPITSGK